MTDIKSGLTEYEISEDTFIESHISERLQNSLGKSNKSLENTIKTDKFSNSFIPNKFSNAQLNENDSEIME